MDMNIEQKVLDLNNEGKSIRQIADELALDRNKVQRILKRFLNPESIEQNPKTKAVEVEAVLSAKSGEKFLVEERVSSFAGWTRTDVANEYSNNETGELMNVKFIKGTSENHFIGHFVKVR